MLTLLIGIFILVTLSAHWGWFVGFSVCWVVDALIRLGRHQEVVKQFGELKLRISEKYYEEKYADKKVEKVEDDSE